MPVGTSNGEYYEDNFDHEHAMMFGGKPGVYNPKSDTWEASPTEDPNKKTQSAYIVRHGDTELNDENANPIHSARGWSPVPLNEDGVKDAQKAADSLSGKGITKLISSDLPRAAQTAKIIGKEINLKPEYHPELRTWDVGVYTGMEAKDVGKIIADYRLKNCDTPVPGGESFNNFRDRVLTGTSKILKDNPDEKLAIVTHHSPERVLSSAQPDGDLNSRILSAKGAPTGGHQPLDNIDTIHEAAEVAAKRQKAAVLRGNDQPSDIALGRGMQNYAEKVIKNTGESVSQMASDLVHHPENFVGTGELTGMFGGVKGSLNVLGDRMGKEYTQAMKMFRGGESPKEIFKQTGWYQDVDNHWKEVIPTDKAGLNLKGWDKSLNTDSYKMKNGGWGMKLPDIYDNPDFYARYPEAKDIKVGVQSGSGQASYTPFPGRPGAPGNMLISNFNSEKDTLDYIHHELQHYIQDFEGFPAGGSEREFYQSPVYLDLLKKLADHRNMLEKSVSDRLKESPELLKKYGYSPSLADDQKYGLTRIAINNERLEDYGVIPNDHFFNFAVEFFKENPDLLQAAKRHIWFRKEIAKERTDPHEAYLRIFGEVEARNAEKWAATSPELKGLYQAKGVSPRDTAQQDVPEDKRIFSPMGKQSFSESKSLANAFYLPEKEKELIDLHKSGLSIQQMADHFDVSKQAVWTNLKRLGLQSTVKAGRKPTSSDIFDKVKYLRGEGMSWTEIGEATGYNTNSLKAQLSRRKKNQ